MEIFLLPFFFLPFSENHFHSHGLKRRRRRRKKQKKNKRRKKQSLKETFHPIPNLPYLLPSADKESLYESVSEMFDNGSSNIMKTLSLIKRCNQNNLLYLTAFFITNLSKLFLLVAWAHRQNAD
jgi:hypothetical protein